MYKLHSRLSELASSKGGNRNERVCDLVMRHSNCIHHLSLIIRPYSIQLTFSNATIPRPTRLNLSGHSLHDPLGHCHPLMLPLSILSFFDQLGGLRLRVGVEQV